MLRTPLQWLNPFHREKGVKPKHAAIVSGAVLLKLLIALAALTAVVVVAPRTTYYRHHFHAIHFHLPHLHFRERVALPALPLRDHVWYRYLAGPGDQSTVGSCAAWSFTKQEDFVVHKRGLYPHHWYSPKWFYTLQDQGQGQGTDPDLYPQIEDQYGSLRHKYWDYPPYDVPASVPTGYPVDRIPLHREVIEVNAPSMAAVQTAKLRVSQDHIVDLGMDVYSSLWDASQTGEIDSTTTGSSMGAHDMSIVAYDDTHVFPNGDVGGFLVQNQWGMWYGVGLDGVRHSTPTNGYVWVSYTYAAEHAFILGTVRYGSAT